MSVSEDLPCKHGWIMCKYKEENKSLGTVFLKNAVPHDSPTGLLGNLVTVFVACI